MNLLIIGGTAYFGTDIVELALEAGHNGRAGRDNVIEA